MPTIFCGTLMLRLLTLRMRGPARPIAVLLLRVASELCFHSNHGLPDPCHPAAILECVLRVHAQELLAFNADASNDAAPVTPAEWTTTWCPRNSAVMSSQWMYIRNRSQVHVGEHSGLMCWCFVFSNSGNKVKLYRGLVVDPASHTIIPVCDG